MIPENRNPRRNAGVFAGAALTLFLATLGVYYARTPRAAAVLPSPIMPSPNAYDSFRAATLAMAPGPPMPGFTKVRSRPYHDPDFKDPRVVAAVLALKSRNETAISTLEHGLQFRYRNPPLRIVSDGWFRPTRSFRLLGKILTLSSQADFAVGRTREGLRMGLDAVEMGQMIVNGGSEGHLVIGAEIQSEARDVLWDEIGHLNAADCAYALGRLKAIETKEAVFADIITETKWTTLAVTNYVIAQSNDHHAFETTLNNEFEYDRARILLSQAEATFAGGRILDQVAADFDSQIAAARLPYGAQPAQVPLDPLPELMCYESMTEYRLIYTRNRSENDLLQAAVALRRYRLAHHAYPRTLGELTPHLLTSIPQDPFAASGRLIYQHTPNGYLLYSVGPDIEDNHGMQIFDGSAQGKERYAITQDSRGDILVHNDVYLRGEPYVQPGRM